MSIAAAVKHLHLICVALTLVLFLFRGGLMFAGATLRHRKWLRVLPHVVDTLLLLSGLYLAVSLYAYPSAFHPWITAKLVALVVYVILGTIALKRARTRGAQVGAFVAALVVFAYIVETAITKTPMPF